MNRSYYIDEAGFRRLIFNKESVKEITNNPNRKLESYEIVIIGAMLYHIDEFMKKNADASTIEISQTEGFLECKVCIIIGLDWNLLNHEDLQILLALSKIFEQNKSHFKEKVDPAFSKETKENLEEKLQKLATN